MTVKVLWRIYYDSGATVDNTTSLVAGVPGDGVIVIVQRHEDPTDPLRAGRELLYDKDFYCYEEKYGRWTKCDIYGLFDYLRQPGWKKMVAGRNTTTENYHNIKVRAEQDPDFPPRSAFLPGEQRG